MDPGPLGCSAGVDDAGCAGAGCGMCVEGQGCTGDSDCQSGLCELTTGQCEASRCDDAVQNGDESGLDCGGSCAPCAVAGCTGPADCAGNACVAGQCQTPPVEPLCADGLQNQDETAIDCGGSICVTCPTCGDGARNQDETAIDCGGVICPACVQGLGCLTGNDCASGACTGNVCQALSGQCTDSAECSCATQAGHDYRFCTTPQVGDAAAAYCQSVGMQLVRVDDATENAWLETAGTTAGVFAGTNGFAWIGANDLAVSQEWAWPDGAVFWSGDSNGAAVNGLYTNWNIQSPNGGNSHCVGMLDTGLWQDLSCASEQPFICQTSVCASCATCGDTLQNQDETGIDCGGSVCSACPDGGGCSVPSDCASSVCTANVCEPNAGGCTPTANCVCGSSGGSDVLLCTTEVTSSEVATLCANAGMAPIKVSGSVENEALRLTFLNNGLFTVGNEPLVWLGGTDAAVEGDWTWYDGELFWDGNAISGVYQNWGTLMPRGAADCLGMAQDGTWRSRACNSPQVLYACESL